MQLRVTEQCNSTGIHFDIDILVKIRNVALQTNEGPQLVADPKLFSLIILPKLYIFSKFLYLHLFGFFYLAIAVCALLVPAGTIFLMSLSAACGVWSPTVELKDTATLTKGGDHQQKDLGFPLTISRYDMYVFLY